jgi:hypothetical protein
MRPSADRPRSTAKAPTARLRSHSRSAIATPNVEINKLFRLVRDDVMEATAGRQEPYTYGSLPGREDFYFLAK